MEPPKLAAGSTALATPASIFAACTRRIPKSATSWAAETPLSARTESEPPP